MASEKQKRFLLVGLAALCLWLGYRTLFGPDGLWRGPSQTAQSAAAAGQPGGQSGGTPQAAGPGVRRGEQQAALASMDPTLRLDLLETSRAVSYGRSTRNIFEFGAGGEPEPGPEDGEENGGETELTEDTEPVELAPVEPTVPLKFYGVAQIADGGPTRAFLTSGETILVAQPGETVADHYKVLRIGTTTIELEDTRDETQHELMMEQE